MIFGTNVYFTRQTNISRGEPVETMKGETSVVSNSKMTTNTCVDRRQNKAPNLPCHMNETFPCYEQTSKYNRVRRRAEIGCLKENVDASSRSWSNRLEIALFCVAILSTGVHSFATDQLPIFGYGTTKLASQRNTFESKSETLAVALKPIERSSTQKRKEAFQAMNLEKLRSIFGNVDERMLQILSGDPYHPDVYGSNKAVDGANKDILSKVATTHRKRPKGRPEFVPGAMTMETMIKYQERKDVLNMVEQRISKPTVSDSELSAIAPYINSGNDDIYLITNAVQAGTVSEAAMTNQGSTYLPTPTDVSSVQTKRKRVLKTLTYTRNSADTTSTYENQPIEDEGRRQSPKGRRIKANADGMNLHKYYRTDLLTSDEEYSLGMKIQFMSSCEQVHEGLSAYLNRLPTIVEWAHACGFTETDTSFVVTEADEQLRPPGADTQFEEIDPSLFVGNGLATEAGPGRGRGRTKRTPPVRLKAFYDDSEYRMQQNNRKELKRTGVALLRKEDLQPINRGTATDFVEMMMTAREAKQRMVQSNMRLVVSISRKYSNVGVSLQDLVQEGSLGLSRAAEKFEPKKGFKFSTYASWWIQQAVFRSIAYHSRTIRLPVHVHNLLNRIRKVRQSLQTTLGRTPTNEEIADQLGMSLPKYNKMIRLTKRSISLETPKYQSNPKDLGHESDDLLGDTIATVNVLEGDSTPERRVDHSLFHEDLNEMMNILNDDERLVISARYGLQDGLTRTVTAVAAQINQSKGWVRSLECRALRKLRRPWYEKKLREHQDALSE